MYIVNADNYTPQQVISRYIQKSDQVDNKPLSIREKAIKSAALKLGTQSGLSWGAIIINHSLLNMSGSLDQIYNFNSLMLRNHVVPPVITQIDNSIAVTDDSHKISFSGHQYTILKGAYFSTASPNWRNYILLPVYKPAKPSYILLPKNPKEQKLWDITIHQSWKLGVNQAINIFTYHLENLNRDYEGMLIYRRLLEMHVVNPPYIEKSISKVSGGKKHLSIGSHSWEITSNVELHPNTSLWQPVLQNKKVKK